MDYLCSIILLCSLLNGISSYSVPIGFTLEQIQVMFRHGDRVPDKYEIYRTDPYDDLFKKLGYGELTNIGKQREYQIGTVLRERYSTFIADNQIQDVYAYSTDYDRTKTSLQLALAGLYPPSQKETWSKSIRWSPIPTNYDTTGNSFLFNFCSLYLEMMQKAYESPAIQSKLMKYNDFLLYIQGNTGISTENILSVLLLYHNIRAVNSMDLPMPKWCTADVYKKLEEIHSIFLKAMTSTQEMSQIIIGPVIKRFLMNINGNSTCESPRKVHLYSGHDINIATFIQSHNITGAPKIPDYGSTIVIEKLRGSNYKTFLRFFLWTGVSATWIPLKLKGCNIMCPLSTYEKLVKPILPDEMSVGCPHFNPSNTAYSLKTDLSKFSPIGQLTYLMANDDFLSFKHTSSIVYGIP